LSPAATMSKRCKSTSPTVRPVQPRRKHEQVMSAAQLYLRVVDASVGREAANVSARTAKSILSTTSFRVCDSGDIKHAGLCALPTSKAIGGTSPNISASAVAYQYTTTPATGSAPQSSHREHRDHRQGGSQRKSKVDRFSIDAVMFSKPL
jgi:hypothetical protein